MECIPNIFKYLWNVVQIYLNIYGIETLCLLIMPCAKSLAATLFSCTFCTDYK